MDTERMMLTNEKLEQVTGSVNGQCINGLSRMVTSVCENCEKRYSVGKYDYRCANGVQGRIDIGPK